MSSDMFEGWQSVTAIAATVMIYHFCHDMLPKISSNKSQTYLRFLPICLQDVPLAGVVRSLGGAGAAVPALPQRDVSGAGTETADAGSPGWSYWRVR